MRKNTHALTASEKPNAKLMYSRADVLGAWVNDPSPPDPASLVAALATCVAEKEKKRNMKVPANSPVMAMK